MRSVVRAERRQPRRERVRPADEQREPGAPQRHDHEDAAPEADMLESCAQALGQRSEPRGAEKRERHEQRQSIDRARRGGRAQHDEHDEEDRCRHLEVGPAQLARLAPRAPGRPGRKQHRGEGEPRQRLEVEPVIEHAAEAGAAAEAAEVVDPEPFLEKRRRAGMQQSGPDEGPRGEGEGGPAQADEIAPLAPAREGEQRQR